MQSRRQRGCLRVLTPADEFREMHLERLHPHVSARLHDGSKLMRLALTQQVAHGVGRDQYFYGRSPPSAARARDQPQSDHACKRLGELRADLSPAFDWKRIDDALQRLRCVLRM